MHLRSGLRTSAEGGNPPVCLGERGFSSLRLSRRSVRSLHPTTVDRHRALRQFQICMLVPSPSFPFPLPVVAGRDSSPPPSVKEGSSLGASGQEGRKT